jgi:hypothetical protein
MITSIQSMNDFNDVEKREYDIWAAKTAIDSTYIRKESLKDKCDDILNIIECNEHGNDLSELFSGIYEIGLVFDEDDLNEEMLAIENSKYVTSPFAEDETVDGGNIFFPLLKDKLQHYLGNNRIKFILETTGRTLREDYENGSSHTVDWTIDYLDVMRDINNTYGSNVNVDDYDDRYIMFYETNTTLKKQLKEVIGRIISKCKDELYR